MNKLDHRSLSFPYPVLPEGWKPYDPDVNYCGPEGKWYAKFLSRRILGVDCNLCYWAHDNRYRLGETEEDRLFADKQMWRDQLTAITRVYGWFNPLRYISIINALRRYHAVRWLGKPAFYAGKTSI